MKYVYPIKDKKKIQAMRKILAADSKRNELLFIVGINSALRISDILKLTFSELYDQNGKPVEYIRELVPEKTKNKKKNRSITFPIAPVLKKALVEYIKDFPEWQPENPIFYSRKGNEAMKRQQAYRILSAAAESVGITDPVGTHTLRKSFAYHLYKDTGNIALVQKILKHSNQSDTLRYIGLEQEEIDAAYMSVNLG